MGRFSGMKNARRGFQSNAVRPGRYLVRIDEACAFNSPNKGEMVKMTLTVLLAEDGDHKQGEQVHVFHKRGSTATELQVFLGNIKTTLCSIFDIDKETEESMSEAEWEENAEKAFSEQNPQDSPLVGHVCLLTVALRDNRDKTGKYPTYSWSAYYEPKQIAEALSEEEIAKFFPNGFASAA